MTIEKQLYKSFGAILLTLVALLVVDIGAILKARSANAEVTRHLGERPRRRGGPRPDHAEPSEPQ